MEPAPKLRLPFKGPILVYGLFALGMASASRLVERHMTVMKGVSEVKESTVTAELETGGLGGLDLGAGGDLESQLAPFMPLAGLPLPPEVLGHGGGQGAVADAAGGGEPGAASMAGEEVPRWTYLMNADQRRAHRGPSAPHARLEVGIRSSPIGAVGHGAPPTARPFTLDFQLLDGAGRPVQAEAVRVTQQGPNGTHHPSAYPSSEGAGYWTGGSPALTPGRCALFTFEVTATDGSVWSGSTLGRAPLRGGVSLGAVTLRPAAD